MGNDTYPPNPIIKSGFSFLKIKTDLIMEKMIIIKEKIFMKKLLFDGVSVLMMHDLNRAWFFKKVFPLISVANNTSYPLLEKYLIKLIAGNIWPPVPPDEKIIFLVIFRISRGIFSSKI